MIVKFCLFLPPVILGSIIWVWFLLTLNFNIKMGRLKEMLQNAVFESCKLMMAVSFFLCRQLRGWRWWSVWRCHRCQTKEENQENSSSRCKLWFFIYICSFFLYFYFDQIILWFTRERKRNSCGVEITCLTLKKKNFLPIHKA